MLEVLLWTCLAIICAVVALVVGLQIPAVQQFAAERATNYLSDRLQTKVAIGRFTTDWENSLVLKEFYLEDHRKDTLIYASHFGVNLNLVALLQNRLRIRSARLENCLVNLYTTPPDSTFNYQFILNSFSSKKASGSGSFFYRVGAVKLKNCRFRLADPVGGTFLTAHIGSFSGNFGKFNSKDPVYDLGKLRLENSFGQYIRTKEKADAGKNGLKTEIRFDKIGLKNISLNYQHKPAGQRFYLIIGKGDLVARETNLRTGMLDLKNVQLDKSNFAWYRDKIKSPAAAEASSLNPDQPGNDKGSPVELKIDKLKISKSGYIFSDMNAPVMPRQFDLKHLKITDLNAHLTDLLSQKGRLAATVKQFKFQEKSGLEIKKINGKLTASNAKLSLQNLDLQSRGSRMKGNIAMDFPARPKFSINPEGARLNVNLNRLELSWKELFLVAPSLAKSNLIKKLGPQPLKLSGNFKGTQDQLKVDKLRLNAGSGTSVNAAGTIQNLGNGKPLHLELEVQELAVARSDLNKFLSGPAKVNLPDKIFLTGKFKGNTAKLNFREMQLRLGGTQINANGTIQGLVQEKKYLDLSVTSLKTGREALLTLLPPGTVSPEINLPKKIHYEGTFRGSSVNDFVTHAQFQTSYGFVKTNLTVVPGQEFSGFLMVNDFNAGKLMKQDKSLGKLTGDANFKGKGFKIKTMELQFDARIKKIYYKKEYYRNIKLDGTLNKNVYDMHGNLKNVVLQELGHKLKFVKKANPLKLPGRVKRLFGFGKKKKKKDEAAPEEEE